MRKKKMFFIPVVMLVASLLSVNAFAGEDAASVEKLESEKIELEEKVQQLESENTELKEMLEKYQAAETETEVQPSTEIVGVQYTDASIVKMVQEALNSEGFDCGTPDGKAGSRTAEAIRGFETSKGINVNGVITDELLEALGLSEKVKEAAEKEAQMKEYSADYGYTQIARDPDSYSGVKMKFRGEVLQEGDAGSGVRYIRLAVNSDYDAVLFVTYDKAIVDYKILEDDIITVYGECMGDYTYETVMGAEVTIPWINANIIDMSEVSM